MLVLTGILAFALAALHVVTPQLRFLDRIPRSRWLSAAGGAAVAYVFFHILPELALHQLEAAGSAGRFAAEVRIYLVAMIGLCVFYGLERHVRIFKWKSKRTGDRRIELRIFWTHLIAFAAYNLLIGYLLVHRDEEGVRLLLLFAFAIGLHFLTTDFGLRLDQGNMYDQAGRWVLAGAVLLGWVIGITTVLPDAVTRYIFAFLAGGVVLNVLKEELPEDRDSRFWPFAGGAAAYAALLMTG